MASDSKLKTLEDKNAYIKAMNAEGVSIIEGVASWCSQCKAIAPEVSNMASEYEGKATFYTFDVDTNPDVAQELGISTMPTFVIFKDGDLMGNVSGAKAKELREAVEQNVAR